MEERKKEARMPEIRDELLDAVAGGTPLPHYPYEGMLEGKATCKRCHQPFSYKYYYSMTLSKPNVPEICPTCENPGEYEYVGR